jgi:hypothetical protein
MDIEPEDMRDHLERQAGAGGTGEVESIEPGAAAPKAGRPEPGLDDDALKALLASIAASYFSLRIGLALLALAFPILVVLLAGRTLDSISAYYYLADRGAGFFGFAPRDVFVGVLCAVGAFLWLYKGYRTRENVALNFAGLAAAAIALFPTDLGEAGTFVGTVHQVAAVSFFLAIAFVCLFEARTTLRLIEDAAVRRMYRMAYRLLGAAMVLLPAAVVLIHNVGGLEASYTGAGGVVFWLELVAIYVFALFWIVKSVEIRTIKAQKPSG